MSQHLLVFSSDSLYGFFRSVVLGARVRIFTSWHEKISLQKHQDACKRQSHTYVCLLGPRGVIQRPYEENGCIFPIILGLARGRFSLHQEPFHFRIKCFEVKIRAVAFFSKKCEFCEHLIHLLPVLLRDLTSVVSLVVSDPFIERY